MPGIYDVTLTVNGTAAIEQVDAITIYQRPTVDFEADVVSGKPPLEVVFTDLSTDVAADPRYRWQLDGLTLQDEGDLTHTFEESGNYTVILSIDNGAGYVVEEKESYIHVKGEGEEELFPGCTCSVSSRSRGSSPLALLVIALVAITIRRR